jgi:hypothetical protein
MVFETVSRSIRVAHETSRAQDGGRAPTRGFRQAAERPAGRTADELPHSIRRAIGQVGLYGETVVLSSPARATAAARAFAAGNGYLPGLIVDRIA